MIRPRRIRYAGFVEPPAIELVSPANNMIRFAVNGLPLPSPTNPVSFKPGAEFRYRDKTWIVKRDCARVEDLDGAIFAGWIVQLPFHCNVCNKDDHCVHNPHPDWPPGITSDEQYQRQLNYVATTEGACFRCNEEIADQLAEQMQRGRPYITVRRSDGTADSYLITEIKEMHRGDYQVTIQLHKED